MKQKVILAVIFVIVVVAVIWGAVWYNNNSAMMAETQQNQNASASGVQISTQGSSTVQITTSSIATSSAQSMGLQIKDITVGTGAIAQNGDTVTVNYIGTLDNGTTFDSSYSRNQPFSFVLGVKQVIAGWDMGVVGMRVGGKRELVIPSDLGYGASGYPPVIPPNATLHFTIELLSVSSTTTN